MRSLTATRWMRPFLGTLLLTALGSPPALADESPEPPPIPRTKPLTYYATLVSTMLPSIPSGILSVANGPDWMAGKTVHQVAAAMMDSDPGTIVTHGSVVLAYDPPDGPRRIRMEFTEGYIRHTNRLRSFGVTSPCAAVSASEAESALLSTVSALGLPTNEWSARRVDTVVDRSVNGEGQDPPTEAVCEIERMVTMGRKASNGLPIFDSKVRETVSNIHERARLLIDWPKFELATGLILRTRTEVIDDLARRIWDLQKNSSGLGAEIELQIDLGYIRSAEGYIPVARADFTDIYDVYAGQILYVALAFNPTSDAPEDAVASGLQFRARVDLADRVALLEFALPSAGNARLTVLDVAGREVAYVAERTFSIGWQQVSWNLQDDDGRPVPSGVYFARLETGREAPVRKLIVIR